MPSQKFKVVVLVLNLLIFCTFLFSLLITTSDPQGALIFIFTLPAIALLSLISFYFSKKLVAESRFFLNLTKCSAGFIILFFVLNFIPVLNKIPDFMMATVSETFKAITGKSPRQYFKDRNDLQILIGAELLNDSEQLDFSKISTARSWSRICVFIPYTSDSMANELVGVNFKLSQYSDIASSDSINVIALFDEKSLVNYVNLKRSILDFDLKNSICIEKTKAQFYKKNLLFGLTQ